jgi:hypothetical protein
MSLDDFTIDRGPRARCFPLTDGIGRPTGTRHAKHIFTAEKGGYDVIADGPPQS